jgi:hypothetical protein
VQGWRDRTEPSSAFALIITPWLIRNFLTFGTPLPTLPLSQTWLSEYTDTFNYLSHPTLQTWLAQGWRVLLDQRLQALLHNGQFFLLSTFAWGLLALPGLGLLRREWSFFPSLMYGLLLVFGVALVFPISSMAGAFQWALGACMPFLALAAIYTLQRVAQPVRQLRKQAAWLSQHAAPSDVIMTAQTYCLNYPSEHPAIVLPSNEPPDSARAAAQQFGTRF